jgi:hypothetical protein
VGIEPPPSIEWPWSPEPAWTSGEERNILSQAGSEINPACCELKNQPLSKRHSRLEVR